MNNAELRKQLIKQTKQAVAKAVQPDTLIIQAVNSLEELDKAANLLAKRLREWYALHNPEFEHAMEKHDAFAEIILKGTDRKEADSMGAEFDKATKEATLALAHQLNNLYELRKDQQVYIERMMSKNFPNLTAVAGPLTGAKLVAIAGGIKKLSLFPASTIQMLGAEKAFFRHLKNKKISPPKYGVLFSHELVAQTKKEDQGRAARALADKICIACKVDYFKGGFVGDDLLKQLQKRFS